VPKLDMMSRLTHTARVTPFLLAGLLATGSAWGQGPPDRGLGVTGTQNLSFGPLFAGVPTTVSPSDRSRSGQFLISGNRLSEVRIDFVLPNALVSIQGAQIPLSFRSGDGGYSRTPSVQTSRAFDPRVPLITPLGPNGRLYLFLGGTALPQAQQQAGRYRAPVTLTISYTGV
jgi:hypothetical protein